MASEGCSDPCPCGCRKRGFSNSVCCTCRSPIGLADPQFDASRCAVRRTHLILQSLAVHVRVAVDTEDSSIRSCDCLDRVVALVCAKKISLLLLTTPCYSFLLLRRLANLGPCCLAVSMFLRRIAPSSHCSFLACPPCVLRAHSSSRVGYVPG